MTELDPQRFVPSYRYADEKLGRMVHVLAVGDYPLRGRLLDALLGCPLRPDDFPPGDLRDEFVRLWTAATWAEPQHPAHGRIHATLEVISNAEVRRIVEGFLSLAWQISIRFGGRIR